MNNLDLLKPKVKRLAQELIKSCKKEKIKIIITQTLRTKEEQNVLYAQGRTTKGSVVTNAKGGYSYHNFGVAFDFCPIVDDKPAWKNKKLFQKVGELGMLLGLEWGGTWKTFQDLPHFQYTGGYLLKDFRNNKIDESKFV